MSLTDDLLRISRTRRSLPPPAVARSIRHSADVTQAELAAALEVDRVTVARWEIGTRVPRGELRLRYVELLERLAAEGGT